MEAVRRAIVTIAFRERYLPYQDRLFQSLASNGYDEPIVFWRDQLPPGAPSHQDIWYGWKPHCLDHARRMGFNVLLWLDAGCYAIKPIEPVFQRIERDGHLFVDNGLAERVGEFTSDKMLKAFNVTRDQAMEMPLFTGRIYGLDLRLPKANEWLDRWLACVPELFEKDRPWMFVSDDPRVRGHRSDESAAALIANDLGMKSENIVGNLFTGGFDPSPDTCLMSGYDWKPKP